jgi:putative ABC transport system ATP-binding protein
MSILQATSVEKHFQEGRETIAVLKGIDFHAERGEIVSLEGPSGSGKTTFLSILGCILTPSAGAVVIDGQPVTANRLPEIRKRSLGFVFQQFNLFPSLTALENVEYALNVKGMKGGDARREAERVIDAVGLGDRQHFLPRELSGGQKQRVAIARAIVADPKILILDEATSSLDSESEALIQDGLNELMKGRTTFVIAHRLSTIRKADLILVFEHGRISESGTHDTLMALRGRYRSLYEKQYGVSINRFVNAGEEIEDLAALKS